MTYTPGRESRFHDVTDLILHIEEHNCRHGCKIPQPSEVEEFGPGGCCPILAATILEESMDELDDDGTVITCTVRESSAP